MKIMKEIETNRLLLRQFAMSDLDKLSPIFGDPEVVRYLGSGKPAKREETEHALCTIIKHWERHGFGRWAVMFKGTRELIGYGGLRCFHGTPELVYLLAKPYWGIGLATEIATTSLKYGFDEQRFERIIAMASLGNTASHRVMKKVGMSFEKNDYIYGMEIVHYSISSAAYVSRRSNQHQAHQEHAGHPELGANKFLSRPPTLPAPSPSEYEAKIVA
jgi:RimJ/RimL family protein N-acetyltransferase